MEEDNKLIAEFMGYKYFGWNEPTEGNRGNVAGWHRPTLEGFPQLPSMQKVSGWYLCRRHSELRYPNSWDWLMPVIDKIRRLCIARSGDTDKMGLIFRSIMMVDIICAHKYVVEFIKWYNSNPLPCASV